MRKIHEIDYWMDHDLSIVVKYCKDNWAAGALQINNNLKNKIMFVMTIIATGLRIQEACDVRLIDCHMDYIHVARGKGGKPRDVEVMPWFRPIYHEFLQIKTMEGSVPLFSTIYTQKTKIDVRHARRWWKDVIDACGARYISPHGGRRTFATWAAELLTQPDLQDQLGHFSYKTTDQFYRGSMPGRRFEKIKPLWLQIGEAWASDVAGRAKLRVVND